MKRIVATDKQRIADWVSEKIGCPKWYGEDFNALGLEADGELVWGIVTDGYVKDVRCTMHVGGTNQRLNREFVRACFDYVFRQLRCKVVIGPVSSANTDALRFDKHLGFKEVGRVTEGAPDGDLVLLQMTKADCRWLETKK